MSVNIIFYVINLDGSDERFNTISKALSKQQVKFIRIPAFDGRKADPINFSEYDESKTLAYMGRKLSGGEIGCYFSHIKCAKTFLDSDADYAVVLEDDVEPTENLLANIKQLILGLENQSWYLINIGANERKIFTPLFYIDEHLVSKAHYYPMTTRGIVWNKVGAQAFIDQSLLIYAPIDNFFRDWLTKLNLGIAVYPPLVSSRNIASEIDGGVKRKQRGRTLSYGWLKQKRLWKNKFIALKHKLFN